MPAPSSKRRFRFNFLEAYERLAAVCARSRTSASYGQGGLDFFDEMGSPSFPHGEAVKKEQAKVACESDRLFNNDIALVSRLKL